ncbi:MAG TPA: MarR family transcriptional regulator [Pseudonocardiaceae bacterium]|nr:MarR family transcriptional regulator [Pseudonocardiaceae bacterium]
MSRDGVDGAAYVLLAHLVAEGPQRISALAEAVHSDPSTVSRQVAQLVQRGLVERRPDPRDGRAARLTATGAGRQVYDDHRLIRNQHTAAALAGWPAADIQHLVTLLGRLNTDFETYRTRLTAADPDTEQEGPPTS